MVAGGGAGGGGEVDGLVTVGSVPMCNCPTGSQSYCVTDPTEN